MAKFMSRATFSLLRIAPGKKNVVYFLYIIKEGKIAVMSTKHQSQEQRRNMMLNEPVSKVIPKMAIPTIVAFLINSIYSLADTYFVSSLGTNATAAVSVNASLDQLIMMCGSMMAVGANSFIASLLGE